MSNQMRTRRILLVTLGMVMSFALVLGGSSTALAEETTFDFRSRGYGHGVGMSQYGARGFADHGYKYDYILRYYYGNAGRDPEAQVVTWPTAEPLRDVNGDRAASSANEGYTKATWTIRPGNPGGRLVVYVSPSEVYFAPDGWSTFTASGSSIIWKRPDGTSKVFSEPFAVWGEGGSPRLTQVKEGTGQYGHTYVRFRGELRLEAREGKIKLINRVSMRDYLYGVVPRESPSGWHMEALKAQAVAARGYSWTSSREELCTTTDDQVYGGHSRGEDRANAIPHETSRTNTAVDATTGQVVTYEGAMVRTQFMSTSGGHTENSENVWMAREEHLRGVPDPYEITAGSPAHTWQSKRMTAEALLSALLEQGVSPESLPESIAAVRVLERGVSGRIMKIELSGVDGDTTFLEGSGNVDRFKRALGFEYQDRWIYVNPKTVRVAGVDRYETAIKAAQRIPARPGTVIVASGTAPADALAASSLAGAIGSATEEVRFVPVLLTPGNALDSRVADWIENAGVSHVYIVGGTGVVSDAVATELQDLGVSVERLGGADRYATAKKVAIEVKRLKPSTNRAIVVNGVELADAVAASAFAYQHSLPIILVRPGSVPPESADALSAIEPDSTLVVGGTGAVSDAVLGTLPGGTRIAPGIDRYESAQLLSAYLISNEGFNSGSVYVASGESLIDGLVLGPVAGYNKNSILFARNYALPECSAGVIGQATSRVVVGGGESVLSGWVEGKMNEACE